MADIATSVLRTTQKNKATESGRSYQLLQLFCQEEFLRRLEKSKYAENLVLRGGLFILPSRTLIAVLLLMLISCLQEDTKHTGTAQVHIGRNHSDRHRQRLRYL